MTQNADDRVIIPLTSCPVCYGYRLKIHRVTGDLLAVVRAEYASHRASHVIRQRGEQPVPRPLYGLPPSCPEHSE